MTISLLELPTTKEREARYARVRELTHKAHVAMYSDREDLAREALEQAAKILEGMPQ